MLRIIGRKKAISRQPSAVRGRYIGLNLHVFKILTINLTGSRFCGPFPKRNHCFQDFSKGRGRGVSSFLLIPFLLLPILAAAQYTTATLSGIINDATGRTVPGARVTIENTGTGLVRAYTTGEVGTYLFPALPVGTYRLQVEKEGFARYSQEGITLAVNQTATQS